MLYFCAKRVLASSTWLNSFRQISTTSIKPLKRVKETSKDNVTTIELEEVPESSQMPKFQPKQCEEQNLDVEEASCSCVLCKIPMKISYKDILILEQFMRKDGTVFPRELTELCDRQQQRLERCVMQAHWSGLFPDRTIPEFDGAGYKRFNRHWDDDKAMFQLKFKMQPGSWFYIKRYNPRIREYRPAKAKNPSTDREE